MSYYSDTKDVRQGRKARPVGMAVDVFDVVVSAVPLGSVVSAVAVEVNRKVWSTLACVLQVGKQQAQIVPGCM